MATLSNMFQINLIAPPLYVVTATCLDRNEGLTALTNVIEKIKQGIEKYRGIFKIKMEPKVVTDVDDATLNVTIRTMRSVDRH
jgi:translation initiation factor 2 subunit 1